MLRLDQIIENVLTYNPRADVDALRKAYVYSAKVHRGKSRVSGEPYLGHSLEIAFILTRLKMDVATIITGLLHDILQQELADINELQAVFGADVVELVQSLTKLGRISFITSEEQQAENFRKMLLAMASDIRVILVKLAERLHDMRTLEGRSAEEQRRIAQETLDIYAPLANRLGISWMKCELEDLSLRYVLPEVYCDLHSKVTQRRKDRAGYVEEVRKQLCDKMRENGIEGECYGRQKHLYSIWRKMQRQGIEFEQVYDLIAFRVIVGDVRDCYAMLGVIHAAWKPIASRFKDYIAMPKANLYQSLHTTVIGPYGERMEVQIRTEDMHRVAEEGIAAHWKYKEGRGGQSIVTKDERQFGWLRQMLDSQQEFADSHEFVGSVKVDLFSEEVYVFTPRGEVKAFPRGATPIDFAYSVHTEVGNRCVGARVNGKLVPLKTPLSNGDVVEVVTSPNQTPSKDWLKFVVTSRAASKIRHWVKTQQREKSIELGKELLEKRLRKFGCSLKKILASREFAQCLQDLGYHTSSDLLAGIGYGKVPLGQIVSRVVPVGKLHPETEEKARAATETGAPAKKPSSAIKIQGIGDIMVRFAKCCNPLPGDPVVGFITRGRGITVHTVDCPSVLESDAERRVEVEWDIKKKAPHTARIRLATEDRKGVLASVSNAISACEANIASATVQRTRTHKSMIVFAVEVVDVEHLNRVINALHQVKGVYQVERLRH
ncbi:RelA/SpoT family protein [Syntrophotalea acetylenica]|uniref:GTP pyrophosphokinase n=1 Tax=Syntrophotalea acetylenica TaxID=29542 RepID=A0A1L3GHT9_SYNAC|nr:bifunctional (p)ppGpp synthetase/guanosine-3',5'-bis(diphosphate) 3'-pyrophosphohydrolase [Syntrophotalea acetylenica]APG25516.1 GTP pyrophosphokinase [Syntrophotalea acetylenica]APG43581.1 GTP pyrophosphokinase [Syntrophotalea acetylenica]MDY0262090.1 bifunctional (p)ppGpp synthetase/guanosine-3',5'-bis(diphosphate) 3'-pyrophosphohydrolase [Syntrophotalea acetylenica]